MSRQGKKSGGIISNIILVIALAVFCFSAWKLWSIYSEYKAGTGEYKKLEELADTGEGFIDFDALEKINADIKGWIRVDGTLINYPIVQGKDNDTYLHTTFEKQANFAGSIFIDSDNRVDFQREPNTILHGHHMKNGTMFADLKEFMKEDFFNKNRKVTIFTKEKTYTYDIFSAYITDTSGSTYTLFTQNSLGDELFADYVGKMSGNSYTQPEGSLPLDGSEPMVTLSTCTDSDGPRRTVVQAVLTETKAAPQRP